MYVVRKRKLIEPRNKSRKTKKSFFLPRVKEIVNAKVFTGIFKTLEDVLFQSGAVAKETAADTLNFFNHVGAIGNATGGDKVLLGGDAAGEDGAQRTPGAGNQNMKKIFLATQLVQ